MRCREGWGCGRRAKRRRMPSCAARSPATSPMSRRRTPATVTVEIMNQRTGKPLWQRSNLTLDGDYDPPNEADGREKALEKLVTNIVEGAQSQW
jgi:hypothetical protein